MRTNKQSIFKTFKSIIFVIVSIAILFFVIFLLQKNLHIETSRLIIEYLKLLLSWPIVVFALVLIFVKTFKYEIRFFLTNHDIKKAGPFEFQPHEIEKPEEQLEESLEQKGITLSADQLQNLNSEFDRLTREITQNQEQNQQNENLINYLAQRAELYEFLYLNLFLVPNTKNALVWSYNNKPFLKQYYDLIHRQNIPNAIEVEAIFNALQQNELIINNQGEYTVTEKGVRFLKFTGLLT